MRFPLSTQSDGCLGRVSCFVSPSKSPTTAFCERITQKASCRRCCRCCCCCCLTKKNRYTSTRVSLTNSHTSIATLQLRRNRRSIIIMCYKCRCRVCGKWTWGGCGKHIDAALKDVPMENRCPNWKMGFDYPCTVEMASPYEAPILWFPSSAVTAWTLPSIALSSFRT